MMTKAKKILLPDRPYSPDCCLRNKGFYCKRRVSGDEIIDFNKNKRELFNFIRALCEPGPKALGFINNKKVFINSSKIINNGISKHKNTIGEIIKKFPKHLLKKTFMAREPPSLHAKCH